MNNQPITNEQTATKHKEWLSKSQRIKIGNSWNRVTKAFGERHTAFQGRGFDPGYWDTFNDCMRQTVSLWSRDTWDMLISFVLQPSLMTHITSALVLRPSNWT
ncbi:unnamed protein product [Acanthocheilonema viteae]|uniref:Uncharacterized protein n=1 Tax=Acanthocheilonema viteae TaxID=6277 RepID=A0A498SDZ3_ACAVI|nr:unnamed protein product [Acanthocheilonema viteae]